MDRNINNKRKILHQPSTTKEYFLSSRRGLNLKEGKVMPVAGKDGWRDGKGGGKETSRSLNCSICHFSKRHL